MKKYGDFSAGGDEFIINRPDTPRPWLNCLSNGQYTAYVSQTGSGKSIYHPGRPVAVTEQSEEKVGRAIFIRDNDSGKFWSLGHYPAGGDYDTFQAVHGLGYTTISSSAEKIDGSATFFVPAQDPCEIWQLKIGNNERKKRRLSIFVYLDLAPIEHCDVQLKNNALLISSKHQNEGDSLFFFALDKTVDSFDSSKEMFIGQHRTIGNPRALEDGKCARSQVSSRPVAVLQRNITLGANTTNEFQVFVGAEPIEPGTVSYQQSRSHAVRRAETRLDKYRRIHAGETALAAIKKGWQAVTENNKIKTPDEAVNVGMNFWAKYQNVLAGHLPHRHHHTANAAKQLIAGAALFPEETTEKLVELFKRQFKEGRCIESIDSTSGYARISDQVDGPAWLIVAAKTCLAETGRPDLLGKEISYFDGGRGSLLEHLIRAGKHCLKQLNGNHLIETDGEESAALTALVTYAIKELLPVLSLSKEHDLARSWQGRLDEISQSFNRRLWDGSWYLAKRNSRRVGSKKSPQRKIDLEAQVWAVLAGLTSSGRDEKVANMAWRQCGTPVGLTNFSPPYLKYDQENPESRFAPGERQNSGVNISLAALVLTMEARLGRGDLAYKAFQQHSHIYLSDHQENYKIEPFVSPAYVFGPASGSFGQGDLAWQKNSGGWLWKAVLEQLLGAQPALGGLKIDPCIPRDWRQVEFSRRFRGADYHFRILNPTRQTKGVERVVVDGIRQTGNVIKPFQAGVHYVEVFLG